MVGLTSAGLRGGGEVEDVVGGHLGAARILDGHVVPVCGALYHRRVRGVGQQRATRVQYGCKGTGVVTHRGGYGCRAWRRRPGRRISAEPRWVFKWKSCTRGGEVASQEVEGLGRGSGGAVVADPEALRAHRL